MAKRHKVHKTNNAWKRDMLLLTCILRLRVQPSVPYPEIVDLFLRTQPTGMARLAKVVLKEAASTLVGEEMKGWLVGYLEEDFKGAELGEFGTWKKAREMDESVVGEMLRVAGLDFQGYVLATQEEMNLQIRWRKEGDWRAGSVPEGPEMAMMNVQESVGDWREGHRDQGWVEMGMNVQAPRDIEEHTTRDDEVGMFQRCWNNQR